MGDEKDSSIKSFLYAWLGKQKVTPNYDVRQNKGGRRGSRFMCELRVAGFPYVAVGNSTSKKDAQTHAARDFVSYCVRSGKMQPQEVPEFKMETELETMQIHASTMPASDNNVPSSSQGAPDEQQQEFPGGGGFPGGQRRGLGGGGFNAYQGVDGHRPMDPQLILQQKADVENSESVDLNARIHGGWTYDNAKSKLHQWLQMTKQFKVDFVYSASGPDHLKSFSASMQVYVKELGKYISGREHASNKKVAAVNCALSIVRQLYHLGVIEAFTGTLAKKSNEALPAHKVDIQPALVSQISSLLDGYGIQLAPPPGPDEKPVSLVVPDNVLDRFTSPFQTPGAVISWSPPASDWNPWISCNIDEGPLAFLTKEQISEQLLGVEKDKMNRPEYKPMYDSRCELPVFEFRDQLLAMIRENNVILVKGETGCGKTTQIPQFILEDYILAGKAADCNIVVTQPRRISAVSVSERIAAERCESVGDSTGYSVRFESVLPRPHGAILFCTVGTLLRKLESGLRGVSHVIVDEIHERDINSDFILIALRDMTLTFPELRVILMSATIDTTLFCQYFTNCPVIQVHGRTFPVQEYFLEDCIEILKFKPPPNVKKSKNKSKEEADEAAAAVIDDDDDQNMNLVVSEQYSMETKRAMTELSEKEMSFELIELLIDYCSSLEVHGAILIFLPGWSLIFSLWKHLQGHPKFGSSAYRVLPLHSQIPREDQRKIFDPVPPTCTKVILSTNIAETSITINDVVFVIDSCKSKVKLFTSHNNMTSYATVWASKTNLEQRRGRAGRVRAGFAFHLCSRSRFEKLQQHSTPEIFLTPLHEIALSIKLLKLGTIREFLGRALEPPPLDAVIEAEVTLKDMKALDKNEELTPLGRVLARLPIEPHIGKTIVLATLLGLGDPMCSIAALVSFPDPFETPKELKFLQYVHKRMAGSRCSDHVALLTAYQDWCNAKERGERSEMDYCTEKQLNMATLRMIHEAKGQLRDILINSEFDEELLQPKYLMNNRPDTNLDVLTSLLVGALYPNVCYHKERRKLLTFDMKPALIHKSSVNNSKDNMSFPSPFFVFGEKLRTRAVSAHQMTMVSPLQLLLMGSRTVTSELRQVKTAVGQQNQEGSGGSTHLIKLDDWINLDVEHRAAASVVALRPIIEDFIMRYTSEPERASQMTESDLSLKQVIQQLSVDATAAAANPAPSQRFDGPTHGPKRFCGEGRGFASGYNSYHPSPVGGGSGNASPLGAGAAGGISGSGMYHSAGGSRGGGYGYGRGGWTPGGAETGRGGANQPYFGGRGRGYGGPPRGYGAGARGGYPGSYDNSNSSHTVGGFSRGARGYMGGGGGGFNPRGAGFSRGGPSSFGDSNRPGAPNTRWIKREFEGGSPRMGMSLPPRGLPPPRAQPPPHSFSHHGSGPP